LVFSGADARPIDILASLVSVARGTAGELGATSSTIPFAALVDFLAVFRALGFGEFLALAVSNALARLGVTLPSGLCDGVRFFEAALADDCLGVAAPEAVAGDARRAVDVRAGKGGDESRRVWLISGIA
jgi:hypothetical protein